MNITKLKRKYRSEILAFERIRDTLYHEDDIEDYLNFIKEKCIDYEFSEEEKEKLNEIIKEIKKISKEIKGYNEFIKYLALFSKVDFDDEKPEQTLHLFEIFYKLFKDKEMSLLKNTYDEKKVYYEAIDRDDILEFYQNSFKFVNEKNKLPEDFYDDEEAEHIVFKILTEKNYDEIEEYKNILLSKILKHYSNPSIFFNYNFIRVAVLFNYYYIIYKILNSKTYKNELSNYKTYSSVWDRMLFREKKHNEYEEEEEEENKKLRLKTHYHIAKTILIILFLLFLLAFGIAGKILALLILLYYALKGMLKSYDIEEW